jgi:cbb3-type cytochrome oxidase subunit 3
MKKSKTKTWICLIVTLVFLIVVYFILDNLNKEGMNLETTCITNDGVQQCVPSANKCESLPDGSYNCVNTKNKNK